ncbi:hypothetical protein NL676_021266 [Syzygium grande]|nr:hypothetical protein NL676_021266 [Syzygium grande]
MKSSQEDEFIRTPGSLVEGATSRYRNRYWVAAGERREVASRPRRRSRRWRALGLSLGGRYRWRRYRSPLEARLGATGSPATRLLVDGGGLRATRSPEFRWGSGLPIDEFSWKKMDSAAAELIKERPFAYSCLLFSNIENFSLEG